jgi:hypothetical protein
MIFLNSGEQVFSRTRRGSKAVLGQADVGGSLRRGLRRPASNGARSPGRGRAGGVANAERTPGSRLGLWVDALLTLGL